MTKDDLKSILMQKYPSQRKRIEERLRSIADPVVNPHLILNEFHAADRSTHFSRWKYNNAKTRPGVR